MSRLPIWVMVVALSVACTAAPVTPGLPPVDSATQTVSPTQTLGVSTTPRVLSATTPSPAPTRTPAPNTPTLGAPTPIPTLGATNRGRIENFTLLGHDALHGRGWNAGLALNYPCVYVGSRVIPQIAIVDVSDPAQPKQVGNLDLAPGLQPGELRAFPDLGLLVVMNFSPAVSLMTFDVHDCLHPRPLATLPLGSTPHEFYLWRDPAQPGRVLAYVAMFNHQQPDLHVLDLSDPAAPRALGTWTAAQAGVAGTLHSISLSPDGRLAYLSMWEGGFVLADASDFALARTAPTLRVLSPSHPLLPPPGVDVHSAVALPGSGAVVLTQEVYACPFGGLSVADVHDPAQPKLIASFSLPENEAAACPHLPQADAVFTAHNPLAVGALVFVTWYGGGLQALDLSEPSHPARVGLFVPEGAGPAGGSPYGGYPVQVWSYPILRQGVLYVSDIETGLYILRYTGPGAEALNAISLAQGNASWNP